MSSGNAPVNALARMDEEIHQQTLFLSNLRANRNSSLPIFRLPPEMLAIVFIHGPRDYYESKCDHVEGASVPTWVNVLYVCRHWRNIALNCPTLWTYPFHTSLRWTEVLLLRSKQAPLKISYTCCEGAPCVLDKLPEHIERIQDLCLNLPRLPAELSLCAHHLEKLEIKCCQSARIPERSVAITDGNKPPLHILKLDSCRVP